MHKRILVAPLDWGLGHTTRCVPLIGHLRALGHVPIVAGNASQLSFIKDIFNNIETAHLDGYNIRYSKWNRVAQAGLLSQLPGMSRAIKAEHRWLEKSVTELEIDGILSDNRYGLYHRSVPSVIMTHQLQVKSGLGAATDKLVQQIHYHFLNRFHNTWVVDSAGFRNLGGELSHPIDLPKHATYIGLLSRFEPARQHKDGRGIVILLSGPEPLRSQLSSILWRQAVGLERDIVFIEGSEKAAKPAVIPDHIKWYDRVGGDQLKSMLEQAGLVICRSGYSTLMDLMALNKKAIVIPTPGQTEQEYLAKKLSGDGVFFSARQKGFDLAAAVNRSSDFPFKVLSLHDQYNTYKGVLEKWLERL